MHTESGRAEDFWGRVRNKIRRGLSDSSKGRPHQQNRVESNPGGFIPGREQNHQRTPGNNPAKNRAPETGSINDAAREQSGMNTPGGRYRSETGEKAPRTDGNDQVDKSRVRNRPTRPRMNFGNPSSGTTDPLSDPNYRVDKSIKTPVHDQLHVDSQNPLTAPGRYSNPDAPTPIHDDANIHNQMNQRLKGRPNQVQEIKNPGDAKNMSRNELAGRRPKRSAFVPREAASGLDQIQQTINVHDGPDPRPMPSDVAFPIVSEEWDEKTTEGDDYSEDKNAEYRRKDASRQIAAVRAFAARLQREAENFYKMADQWGASDSPNAVPGGSAANSPLTTPPRVDGKSYEQGVEDGMNDKLTGERPSFSDASSSASEYIRGYSEGYSRAPAQETPKDVPESLDGDSGQALNSQRVDQRGQTGKAQPLSMGASLSVAASFTEPEAGQFSDFRKGYNYGWSWTPQRRMVSLGSAEFEAGLYAGITDNPEYQREFVETNKRHASLSDRLSNHREFTQYLLEKDHSYYGRGLYVQGSTSTDLNIMGPGVSPDPMGQTPSMGIGEDPPNKGGEDPARPGGPAPYNAAPPLGEGPAVENPVVGPPQDEPLENPHQAAFRARVQSNLRNRRGQR